MSSVQRSVVIYACAFAVAGAVPFVLLPILTHYLTPAQFGEVTAFLMFAALLGNVVSMSAHGFVAVRYFKAVKQQLVSIVGTSVALLVLLHFFALIVVWISHDLLLKTFELTLAQSLLAVFAAFFMNLCLVWLALFQASGRAMNYLQARLIQGALELIICVVLLVWILAEPTARTASYTLALAASAVFGFQLCWRRGLYVPSFNVSNARALLAFGVPLLPHVVSGTVVVYLDRLVVSKLLGAEGLGLYMVSMQIGMSIVALTEPLNKALAPWLFLQLAKNDEGVRRMVVKRTYMFVLALLLLGLTIGGLAILFFDDLIDARFSAAKNLIPWMVGGFVMQGLYTSMVNYLFFSERTGWLSLASASTAIIGCMVSLFMVSNYGIEGAAMSFAFNNGLLFFMVWVAAAHAVPMPWLLRPACQA